MNQQDKHDGVLDHCPPHYCDAASRVAMRPVRGHHAGPFGSRDYLLFAPDPPAAIRPALIVMLHGCNQDVEDFARGTRMHLHAARHQCYVAYPAQAAQANAAKCWNWWDAMHQQRDTGEPAIIAGLTRRLIADYSIAADKVFIAGFSAGGAMAATMAVLYPDVYAALGIHSGVPHGAARDFLSAMVAMQHGAQAGYAIHPSHGEVPTIVFHGDEDNMVHATHAAQFMTPSRRQRIAACTGEHRTESFAHRPGSRGYTRTLRLDREEQVFSEQWIVHGGGHAWYGGDATGAWVDPDGPDAAREMVRYFIARGLTRAQDAGT
jgi:poly(hydroxyalkanoate) depolymerase family esterase